MSIEINLYVNVFFLFKNHYGCIFLSSSFFPAYTIPNTDFFFFFNLCGNAGFTKFSYIGDLNYD